MTKPLFVVSSGIGNQVEAVPAFMRVKREFGCVDVVNSQPYAFEATKVIFDGLAEKIMKPNEVDIEKYHSQYWTYFAHEFPIRGISVVSHIPHSDLSISEVEHNMKATNLPYDDDDFSNYGDPLENINANFDAPDVLIHDGYNKNSVHVADKWKAKSFKYWNLVADDLKSRGYTVGSIGSSSEYVQGTIDLTGKPLRESISYMKGCRLFMSNDTGTYHVANLIRKCNIVVFTFTHLKKNYDKRFHSFSRVIKSDLECAPCHYRGQEFWLSNKGICGWKCREISNLKVLESALSMLSE